MLSMDALRGVDSCIELPFQKSELVLCSNFSLPVSLN